MKIDKFSEELPKHNDANCFENHLNPGMLVLIG